MDTPTNSVGNGETMPVEIGPRSYVTSKHGMTVYTRMSDGMIRGRDATQSDEDSPYCG